jgi:translation initiation factor 2 subunit 1
MYQHTHRENFRFYEAEYPKVNEVVIVKVKSVKGDKKDKRASVSLLEYNNIEGSIKFTDNTSNSHTKEDADGRIKKLQGKHISATVLSVDEKKKDIQLSECKESEAETSGAKKRYEGSKKVHSILCNLASSLNRDLEVLYQTISWPLARKFEQTYTAFSILVQDSHKNECKLKNSILSDLEQKLDKEVINALLDILRKGIVLKIQPQLFEKSSKLNLTCTAYEGVKTIKNAMRAAVKISNETAKVEIWVDAAPHYLLKTKSFEKEVCDDIHEHAIQECKIAIESFKGNLILEK